MEDVMVSRFKNTLALGVSILAMCIVNKKYRKKYTVAILDLPRASGAT